MLEAGRGQGGELHQDLKEVRAQAMQWLEERAGRGTALTKALRREQHKVGVGGVEDGEWGQMLGEGGGGCLGHTGGGGLWANRRVGFPQGERENQADLVQGQWLPWGEGHRRGDMLRAGPPLWGPHAGLIVFPLLQGSRPPVLAQAHG